MIRPADGSPVRSASWFQSESWETRIMAVCAVQRRGSRARIPHAVDVGRSSSHSAAVLALLRVVQWRTK